jgi:hypothetical protein
MATSLKAESVASPLQGRTTCRRRKPATRPLDINVCTTATPSSSTDPLNTTGTACLSSGTAPPTPAAPPAPVLPAPLLPRSWGRRYPLHSDAVPQFNSTSGTSTAAMETVVLLDEDFTATVITIHLPSTVGTMAKPSGPKPLSQ